MLALREDNEKDVQNCDPKYLKQFHDVLSISFDLSWIIEIACETNIVVLRNLLSMTLEMNTLGVTTANK